MRIRVAALAALFLAAIAAAAIERRGYFRYDPAVPSLPGAAHNVHLAAWKSVDSAFFGCAFSCGARWAREAPGTVAQPGARPGDSTYCPVSGVVFQIKPNGARKEWNGRTLYFCCGKCADFFEVNTTRVVTARGFSVTGS